MNDCVGGMLHPWLIHLPVTLLMVQIPKVVPHPQIFVQLQFASALQCLATLLFHYYPLAFFCGANLSNF
ncbi:hypothetical protein XELAEV_18018788mg [Xenopus laevis]|uniref:Uncharacterized protein n=1 Tax=Xenopus laevis TaxID=8355 RepID=A0A974DE59_XENLA|nr:hypothetical protein XELAEV_18018788mg [Xenopus laevis]